MTFYTLSALKIYRYPALFVFIGLPMCLASPSVAEFIKSEDRIIYTAFCFLLTLCGIWVVHIAFWEKCFAVLTLTDDEIRWTCPLRKTKVIPVAQCKEIGAYLEQKELLNFGTPQSCVTICLRIIPIQTKKC